jgi:hypothetical protein
MEAEKDHKAEKRRRTKIKIAAWVLACVDGEVDFGGLSMSWFKGIQVSDITFGDDMGRMSVTARQISTKLHYGSILGGSLSFGETIVDEPRVKIKFEGLQAKPSRGFMPGMGSYQERGASLPPVKEVDLVVKDGRLKVTDRVGGRVEVTGISCGLAVNTAGGYRVDEPLVGLAAKGKLGFERAEYMGFDFGRTEVDVQIQDGVLKIAPFSATVNKGEVSFAGEADFKQKPTLLKTPGPIQVVKDVQIDDETTKRLLMYLNPVFADAVNVSGVANLECERLAIPLAGATKNDIEIVGTVSINELRLQASELLGQILSVAGGRVGGQVITVRPTKFTVRDGSVKYDDMQMDVGNNPVNFKGVIGLDKSLNMTVTLPYTYEGRTVRVGQADTGDRVSVPLKGTLDKPELDLGRMLQEQLLERGLRELFK